MLQIAAKSFDILPRPDALGNTLVTHQTEGVYTPLRSSLVLLDDGTTRIALLTSHFGGIMAVPVSNLYRRLTAAALGLDSGRLLLFSSHNHCSPLLTTTSHAGYELPPDRELKESELTPEGRKLLDGCLDAASGIEERLQPVEVRYGIGHERRISYNRKGRRADGSTFFMRECDRLMLGEDFCGDIDDEAPVVGFFDNRQQPVAFLTQFTGHPVTAYHCEHVVIHGEYPQIACEDLSDAFANVPVAFLQGCAGDVNSKGLLSDKPVEENIQDAERFGHFLGDTYRRTAASLTCSKRSDLAFWSREVKLPFRRLPSLNVLTGRLQEVEAFIKRCDGGDDAGTRECDGLNFPPNMTPPYRKVLIEPTRQWLQWAIRLHREKRADEAPRSVSVEVAALRIGDVGIVGLSCEPFMGIGREIKQISQLPLTIPCGYMNNTRYNYVPDSPNCGDADYMSSFYRYRIGLMPYRRPAGSLLARAGTKMLEETIRE